MAILGFKKLCRTEKAWSSFLRFQFGTITEVNALFRKKVKTRIDIVNYVWAVLYNAVQWVVVVPLVDSNLPASPAHSFLCSASRVAVSRVMIYGVHCAHCHCEQTPADWSWLKLHSLTREFMFHRRAGHIELKMLLPVLVPLHFHSFSSVVGHRCWPLWLNHSATVWPRLNEPAFSAPELLTRICFDRYRLPGV